jgi:TRAP-type C4-dicarboxylate transport system substrate-binding protein
MASKNKDVLTIPFEELPDEDKQVITKALEQYQDKCLVSYSRTRDNKIIQKYPLPRVLLHG